MGRALETLSLMLEWRRVEKIGGSGEERGVDGMGVEREV